MASFESGAYATEPYAQWLMMFKRGATDWASGTLEWPANFPFDNWNFPYMCGMCKRGEICDKTLMRCNKCKIAHYCGREHQLKAWPVHKLACKHFASVSADFNPAQVTNASQWAAYIQNQFRLVGTDPLKHRMNSDEWLSQRHCHVCFHNPAGPSPDRKLKECPTCHCAAHCASPECTATFQKLHTAQACESYMIGLAALVITMQGGGQAVQNTQTRETALCVPADWSEFFTRKINDMDCPPAFMRMPPMMAMVTDSLSLPMTIVRSLHQAHGDSLRTMRRIEVHVVGNELAEVFMFRERYHEMLHWLPACRELLVYFIAPQANSHDSSAKSRVYSSVPETLCAQCSAAGAKMYARFVHGLYHDVVAAPGTLAANNATKKLLLDGVSLVIACNSGIHDEAPSLLRPSYSSTWQPTLQFLINTDIPCVFTSYNANEMVHDRALLQSMGARITVEPHVNPFRGLRPFPEIGEDNKFYFTNQSCVMFRGAMK